MNIQSTYTLALLHVDFSVQISCQCQNSDYRGVQYEGEKLLYCLVDVLTLLNSILFLVIHVQLCTTPQVGCCSQTSTKSTVEYCRCNCRETRTTVDAFVNVFFLLSFEMSS